jgi:hypothetical protein
MPAGGTRLQTTASAVPRRWAVCSSSHGTASAYRAAVVTKIHRSAAASSWAASSRLPATTESTSGASSNASPGGTAGCGIRCSEAPPSGLGPEDRANPGSTRPSANQRSSPGAHSSTGERVVGRSTPAAVTGAPTRVFTSVDLPAPVDPPTTASSGASSRPSRGSR